MRREEGLRREKKLRQSRLLTCGFLLAVVAACSRPPSSGTEGEGQGPSAEPAVELLEPLAPECPTGEVVPETIKFGVTPYFGYSVIEEQFEPILKYLEEKTGHHFELVRAESYARLIEMVEKEEVDIFSLSPLSYVRAKVRLPCLQLMLTQFAAGSVYYRGYIVVRAESPHETLEDLKGAPVAMLRENSTSGYLFPRAYLLERGIDPDSFFRVVKADNHADAMKLLVEEKKVEAAATFSAVFQPLRDRGIDAGNVRVLAITGRIPYDAVCAQPYLSRRVVVEVAHHMYRLNSTTGEGRRIIRNLIDMNGWIYTRDSIYDTVRVALGRLEK